MKFLPAVLPLLVALALTGCAPASPDSTPAATSTSEGAASCDEVAVVVDFGSLEQEGIEACAPAGVALDVLHAAGIETEGTADFGDAALCRVEQRPSPDVETCATFSDVAYWALWVRPSADAKWEFALEGVADQELADGQSLGLVYTPVNGESLPPQG
ncbi:MAG TPA: hypothetical protein VNS80_02850 [Pseudolysinimonas sp.]|nr:hypothetical protein [Pseudolysinimonas sp.]